MFFYFPFFLLALMLLLPYDIFINSYFNFGQNFFNHIIFSLNTISSGCLTMLLTCGILALIYSLHYFHGNNNSLNSLISLFILVMVLLILSHTFITSLIFWEFLGFTSYLLILFYSIYDSSRAANITLFSSRFGDVGFFFVVALLYSNFNSPFILLFSLLFIITSKSASFPFISWLLEAMRAPTPVSSLVHSSTLVAAGTWFSLNYLPFVNTFCSDFISFFCFVTIFISAGSALILKDVKKLIALSTCNNISWCLVYCFWGEIELSLIQLVSHGIAKCALFCVIGDILSFSYTNQNSFLMGSYFINFNYNSLISGILVIFLTGLPYQGVYFSKHYFLSGLLFNGNIILFSIIFFLVLMSYLYSFRLLSVLSNCFNGPNNNLNNSFYLVSLILFIFSFFNFYLAANLAEVSTLSSFWSLSLIFFQFIFSLIGYFSNGLFSSNWFNSLGGLDIFVDTNYSFLSSLVHSVHSLLSLFRWEVFSYSLISSMNVSLLFSTLSIYLAIMMYYFFI
uniref:NADH dehydrogenase subunit 5 n=1 Tax=Tetraonchus monenteron TaxID=198446 RepID=UPI001436B6C7|nr:NADH dehydrogenase subunit 5 [Tetraonchus monenteron]QIH29919.1 NADH dehydrogenase subunit 5 [Tetraonchus monenteron]